MGTVFSKRELSSTFSINICAKMDCDKQYSKESLSPLLLLNANRFDLVAKYIYAKSLLDSIDSDFAEEVYLAHINVFNGFVEADGSGKVGERDFINSYKSLLSSVVKSGFSEQYPVPLSRDGIILDGAHRVGLSLALKEKVVVVKTDIENPVFDYSFFERRGLQRKHLDFLAYEYAKLKPNTRMVLLWPTADGMQDEVESVLNNYGKIVYFKNVFLTLAGAHSITASAYSEENWVGSRKDGFPGAANKANWCFSKPGPLRVFLIESDQNLIAMKDEIRSIFSAGKHSIHVNDTHLETIELAQCLFNENTISCFNSMAYRSFSWFDRLFTHYTDWISDNDLNIDDFCIDGSGSLAAFGIRDVRDLDFLYHGNNIPVTGFKEIDCHNHEHEHKGLTTDDIIFNPSNHFYYRGAKFVSISLLRKYKERRIEVKDLDDVREIKAIMSGSIITLSFFERVKRLVSPQIVKARIKLFLLKTRYFLTIIKKKVK